MTSPSDAPIRTSGTHTRSGNAMARTRSAILAAAAVCLHSKGVRKTTMSDVSTSARVAKATLYNHFRTKDDLLAAVVSAQLETLAAQCAELAAAGLQPALEHAGRELGANPALRRVAADEPALLAGLGVPAQGRLWDRAREAVRTVLRESGAPSDPVAVDLTLRWLCGHVMWAASPSELTLGARLLAVGLGRAPAPVPAIVIPEEPSYRSSSPAPAGVGWPG